MANSNGSMFRFEQLEIWKQAIDYAKFGYRVVETLPKSEDFGLKPQMKRAYVSISSNIAEGSGSVTAIRIPERTNRRNFI